MPVFIYEDDAFEKMAAVEQDDRWIEMQRDGRFGSYSFDVFREEWERVWKPRLPDLSPSQLTSGIDARDAGSIYGSYGWNRYTVRVNGEIMFIRMQARSGEDVQRALEQGFRMFPPERPR